jgi:hypothetical protein
MTQHISFGDNVRVRSTPETIGRGLAAQTGQVYGVTTPSVTNVEVIGTLTETDCAFNVHFNDRNESFWFAAELLELLDHAPGTEIRLDGVPKKWTRLAAGTWVEETTSDTRKSWWKFW